ncbi:MAG TPA: protein tyrosine phosphatase, partial [Nitrosopumilus sp.]|nr:protein tyrosine phosphatase [Nitrosopumilus sp.]
AIQAIKKIRDERPGSIQSDVQELAISYYEKYVRN